jgi:hypothetical protein
MFETVTLPWTDGKSAVIPPKRVLGAIAVAEQFLTLGDIAQMRERPPLAKIAQAYAAVLRYADPESAVTDDEVYGAVCDPAGDGQAITAGIAALVAMMVPRSIKVNPAGNPAPGKGKVRRGKPGRPKKQRAA